MNRGGGRGGRNGNSRGAGQQNIARARRYNIRNAGESNDSAGDTSPHTVAGKSNTTTSSNNIAPRDRRPSSIITSTTEIKPTPPVEGTPKNEDPDYMFRSKIPLKDPKMGYGIRYNPNDPKAKIPVTKIHVSGTSKLNRAKLKNLFSVFGSITNVFVVNRDIFSYAFITFQYNKDALKALDAGSLSFERMYLKISAASQKHQPKPTHVDKLAAIDAPDKCFIDNLNDDCLRHIFSYLSLMTRTRIEVVCKSWHRLSRNMWLVVRSLNFCTPPLGYMLAEASPLYDFTAIQLTSYTGHNLSSLTIKRFADVKTMKNVRDNCTSLERLTLVRFQIFDTKVNLPSLKSLKYLGLECCTITEKVLTKMFAVAKSLESVSILRHLSDTNFIEHLNHLKSFTIAYCELTQPAFNKFLTRNGAVLKTLSLIKCDLDSEMNEEAVNMISNYAPKLESLTLDRFNRHTEALKLTSLYKLSHLTSLSLCYNSGLTADILTKVIRNCTHLTSVSLDHASHLSSESIAALGKLPQLKQVSLCHISETNGLNNEGVMGLNNEAIIGLVNNLVNPALFQHLSVANTSLSDEAMYAVLTLCPGLEYLNISNCHKVTEATLMTAEEAVVARTHPPLRLSLIIDSTSIKTAVDQATALGKTFNSRLVFTEPPGSKANAKPWAHSWEDDGDTDDDDDDDDDDLMRELVDSDEEYMYLMGLGIDRHEFENGLIDLDDFLNYRLAGVQIAGDSDLSDDDAYYGGF